MPAQSCNERHEYARPEHTPAVGLAGLGGLQEQVTGGAGIAATKGICGRARERRAVVGGTFMVREG